MPEIMHRKVVVFDAAKVIEASVQVPSRRAISNLPEDDEEWKQWEEAHRADWDRKMAIAAMFNMPNPNYHFGAITSVLGIGTGIERPVLADDPD